MLRGASRLGFGYTQLETTILRVQDTTVLLTQEDQRHVELVPENYDLSASDFDYNFFYYYDNVLSGGLPYYNS
jgi:hypothetical protein